MDNEIEQGGDVAKNFDGPEPEQTQDSNAQTGETVQTEAEPVASNAADNGVTVGKQEKKGHGGIVALAVLLVLILAGCVGAYFLLAPKSDEKKDDDKKPGDQTATVSSYRLSGNDFSDFDLRFLQIESKEENVVYSPLSIKYALAMLKDGANGETKKQIESLIGDYKAKSYTNSKNTSLANAMFIREDYKEQVLSSYISGLKKNYNAEVVYDAFKDASVVNDWVAKKTLGLVKNALSERDIEELNYALVNALAIDQKWNYLIQCQRNDSKMECMHRQGDMSYSVSYAHEDYHQSIEMIQKGMDPSMKFNGKDKRKAVTIGASFNRYDIFKEVGEDKIREKVTEEYKKWLQTEVGRSRVNEYNDYHDDGDVSPTDVNAVVSQYMKDLKANYGMEDVSTDFYMNDAADAKVFAKDLKEYDGTTLQYVGIMPKEKDLKSFVNELTAEKGKEYIDGLIELKKENFKDGVVTRIDAQIPLFEYDYDLSLKNDLEALGVKDVFVSGKADLSNMTKESSFITIAKHKTNIEFSNEGIKAAAVTALIGAGGGGERFEYLWDVPVEKIDLTFDKPFMYLIRDKATGEVWFVGMVYEPTEVK